MVGKISLTKLTLLGAFFTLNLVLTGIFFAYLFQLPKYHMNIQTDTGVITGTFITLGVLAYTFGLRHAVDADHLAAIDNTTRKMIQEGKDPWFIGTMFSLGHSTVVILLSLTLMIATRFIVTNLDNFENIGSIIGTLVSAGFLYILAFLNTLVLFEIYSIYI